MTQRQLPFDPPTDPREQQRQERVERLLGGGLRAKIRPASDLKFDYRAATAIARRRNANH